MGGAKKHGETNFTLEAPVTYTFPEADNPITKGASGFEITDEAFFLMTWAKDPAPKMLATSPVAPTRSAGTHAGESRRRRGPTSARSSRASAASRRSARSSGCRATTT